MEGSGSTMAIRETAKPVAESLCHLPLPTQDPKATGILQPITPIFRKNDARNQWLLLKLSPYNSKRRECVVVGRNG